MHRVRAMGLSLAMLLALGALPLLAQEPGAARQGARAPIARRVPRYYGQIGLTPDQKEEIYLIQAKYRERIEALKAQIEQAEAQLDTECQSVLTDSQRGLLEQRRGATKSRRAQPNEAPADSPAGAAN